MQNCVYVYSAALQDVSDEELSGRVCIHSGMAALQIVVPYQPVGLQMRGSLLGTDRFQCEKEICALLWKKMDVCVICGVWGHRRELCFSLTVRRLTTHIWVAPHS